jgi:hypothetical protein
VRQRVKISRLYSSHAVESVHLQWLEPTSIILSVPSRLNADLP